MRKFDALAPMPAGWPITQDQLREFVTLRHWAERFAKLQELLLAKLEEGSTVQKGPLTAQIVREETRCLTLEKLTDLIGAENVEVFLEHVEPTTSTTLYVGW